MCCLVVTIRTRIFTIIMQRSNMCLQTSLSCCLLDTMRTRILNNIMYTFYMYPQIVLCWSLVITMRQGYLIPSCTICECLNMIPSLLYIRNKYKDIQYPHVQICMSPQMYPLCCLGVTRQILRPFLTQEPCVMSVTTSLQLLTKLTPI